jgi:hypothetical protein
MNKSVARTLFAAIVVTSALAGKTAYAVRGPDRIFYRSPDNDTVMLFEGQGLLAAGGYYRLVLKNGRLTVYGGGASGTELVWTAPNGALGAYAQMVGGDFTLFDRNGVRLWHTKTQGYGDLVMQDDGNLCFYPATSVTATWCSFGNISPTPRTAPITSYPTQTHHLGEGKCPGGEMAPMALYDRDVQRATRTCAQTCARRADCEGYSYVSPKSWAAPGMCWLKRTWPVPTTCLWEAGTFTGVMDFKNWPN